MARPFDHLVLASQDLEDLAGAYRRLGFLVGGRNRHPWGTENHVVQLEGSFIELLGLGADFQPLGSDEAAAPFANPLARYIGRREGLAMLALRSEDAIADAQDFAEQGIGLGRTLHFERSAEGSDGTRREVAFTIAFALDPAAPTAEFFVCQHHRPENFWNAAAQLHPNTARRLKGIILVADQPSERAEFLGRLFGHDAVKSAGWGVLVESDGVALEIMTPDVLHVRHGAFVKPTARSDPGFVAYRIEVESVEAVQRFLNVMGSPYEARDGRLIVPASVARGVMLSFEPRS